MGQRENLMPRNREAFFKRLLPWDGEAVLSVPCHEAGVEV